MPEAFVAVESQLRRITTLLRRAKPRPRTLYEGALLAQFLRAACSAPSLLDTRAAC